MGHENAGRAVAGLGCSRGDCRAEARKARAASLVGDARRSEARGAADIIARAGARHASMPPR